MARGIFEMYKRATKNTPAGMEENLYPDAASQKDIKDEARSNRAEARAARGEARDVANAARQTEAHAAKMKETAAKMPYTMGKSLKRGLLAAGGLAAGGAGVAAYLKHRQNKEEESMMKESFSITPEGHQYDAEVAELARNYAINNARIAHKYRALGGKGDEDYPSGPPFRALRFGLSSPDLISQHPILAARHLDYVMKKHKKNENAYNPFGGQFTPLPVEGTRGTGGVFSSAGIPYSEEDMKKESASPKTIAMLLGAGAAAGAGSTIGAKHLANTYIKSKEQRELEAALRRGDLGDGMESLGACKKSSSKIAMEVLNKIAATIKSRNAQ